MGGRMKELTKEECIKALDEIWFEANNGAIMCGDEISEEYNEILTQLIEEYFNLKNNFEAVCDLNERLLHTNEKLKENPPLKFEELKEGMWVWDNFRHVYFQIMRLPYEGIFVELDLITGCKVWKRFGENRFYRREVKE